MKYLALALALLLVAGAAHAQTAPAWNENRMVWEASNACSIPTEPLSRCPVASYIIEHQLNGGPRDTLVTVPGTQLTYTHIAQAGENCYRWRAVNTIAGPSIPSVTLCKTNVQPAPTPPPPQIPPAPPTNPRFVTVPAVANVAINGTPVVTILGTAASPRGGSIVGLVPVGRATQGPPLFPMLGRQWCRVEVGTKEVFIAGRSLRDLAAPCAVPGA